MNCANCNKPIPCPINIRRAKRRGYGYCGHSCAAPKPTSPIARFWTYISSEPTSGCWLWTGPVDAHGYGTLSSGGAVASGAKHLKAHRIAYSTLKGAIGADLYVCHHCDNRLCVNPDHLFLGTNQDNLADMRRKGRHIKGRQCHQAKLSEAAVVHIRQATGTHTAVAEQFGVSVATASRVRRGLWWKHVEPAR
jgi:hypothetical protein